eukprot:m.487005 g.487005  ORF g.487005 m.487005 type:complete len:60 (+) comp81790_c0_seq1:121-300(+)
MYLPRIVSVLMWLFWANAGDVACVDMSVRWTYSLVTGNFRLVGSVSVRTGHENPDLLAS